jgi:hypothetical protein
MDMDYEMDLGGFSPDDWLALFNTSTEDLEATEDEYTDVGTEIFRVTQQYLPPIHVIASCFGNTFALVIMARLREKVHQLHSYLLIVAALDFIIILWSSGNDWLMKVVGRDYLTEYMNNSDICCKVLTYFRHLFIHLSVWMTLTLCIENVCFHLRPRSLRHFASKRITDVVCLLLVLVMCFNLHYFWTYGVMKVDFEFAIGHIIRDHYCFFLTKTLTGTKHQTDSFVWRILDTVLVEFLPVLTVFICQVLIGLAKKGKIAVSEGEQREQREKTILDTAAVDEFLSKTLVALGWALPITFLPSMVVQNLDKEKFVRSLPIIEAITKEWKTLFFSCKFFLYLAASTRVRREFIQIVFPFIRRVLTICTGGRIASWFEPKPVGSTRPQQLHAEHQEQV